MQDGLAATATFSPFFFYAFAAVTVLGALGVASAQNIVYSAFSLLAAFSGVVGLYAYLSADLLAVVQLMVYVGGILVLILFAVMLTNRISESGNSNPTRHWGAGMLVLTLTVAVLVAAVVGQPWTAGAPAPYAPSSSLIGDAFLGEYILPFEIAGVVLLAALIAAVVVARKEVKEDEGAPSNANP